MGPYSEAGLAIEPSRIGSDRIDTSESDPIQYFWASSDPISLAGSDRPDRFNV